MSQEEPPAPGVGASLDAVARLEREQNYDALFQAMSEGFALCQAIWDEAGALVDYTVLQVNPALLAMLGMGPELIGKRLSETGLRSAEWLALCESALRTGEPVAFEFNNPATGRWHEIRVNRLTGDRMTQFFFDITERKAAAADLVASQSYLRLILDAAADAFYCVDKEGHTTHCNAAFLRLLGFPNEKSALGGKLHDVIHHSHPDGSPYPKRDCPIYQTAQTGEAAHVDDEIFFRLDGSSFPVEYWVRPILRDGALQGAICTFQDITDRKAAEESQDLLLREMNHRVKNLFAVVSGVVALSSRSVAGPKEMAAAIRGRLEAIARAHELIVPTSLRGEEGRGRRTDLATLATAVLSPYQDGVGPDARLKLSGAWVAVGDKAANALALVLHELATNAVKYGALSGAAGQVRLAWKVEEGWLDLTWEERGGPAVAGTPDQEGFGSILARRSVAGQLRGQIVHDWNREGLAVRITAPLEQLVA